MKRLIYQVYVGKKSKLYDTCVDSVEEYCKANNIDHYVQTTPKLRIKPDVFATNRSKESYEKYGGFLPIYEKENAFEMFRTRGHYDQIAIIDADIYIKPGSPNIFESIDPDVDFAGVVEREMPLTEEYTRKIINYSNMQYLPLKNKADFKHNKLGFEFYNMGLMVMNRSIMRFMDGQSPKQFIMRSEFKDFVDGKGAWKWSTDQTLLNYWIKKYKIREQHLDWRWNGLYKGIKDDEIKEAYFIHFFLRDKLPNRGENILDLVSNL